MTAPSQPTDSAVEAFIARWQDVDGSERANYQLFLTELTDLLGLPKAGPAGAVARDNAYVFERRVIVENGDGTTSDGFIDLYRRGAFVCEAKRAAATSTGRGFDTKMRKARSQAETYARALPADEGRPPLLLVVDVGRVIEMYAEFSRTGGTYTPFPDQSSHRVRLPDLRTDAVRERLRQVWLDPLGLDPTRRAAKATRDIARTLAEIAKTLEADGHAPEEVGQFLTRCLFTFFAEDVGLLPKRSFADLLDSIIDTPQQFVPLVAELWRAMDEGKFSTAIRTQLLRFNGKLFKDSAVLPLTPGQIALLRAASRADWSSVEPAIFGTLLERALDPKERHELGAHYTPRAYVERLVLPTVIEPLREDWQLAQAAALASALKSDMKGAQRIVHEFHRHLCSLRVLDPACGSGNFLYVTLEHMKRLEGEVLDQLKELGDTTGFFDLGGGTVDPHQFLGIEVNPRAAAIAEMVLWIGYLQWHYRTRGNVQPPEPVLRDFRNIECRDAVLVWNSKEAVTDDAGAAVTRWDGESVREHPATGEWVPDDTGRTAVTRYVGARAADWPDADFVVGNPPFVGNKRMRTVLGDSYVEALRAAWPEVPGAADYVMYWWHRAAELTRAGVLRRFGLITTNSLRQAFSRKVVAAQLDASPPLSIAFAIPDHPWVDSADGADVRISMTVGVAGRRSGRVATVAEEVVGADGEATVRLLHRVGDVQANLAVGAAVSSAVPLRANQGVCFQGMNLVGKGFRLTREDVVALGYDPAHLPPVIPPHYNARDHMQGGVPEYVIDFFGWSADDARDAHPALYQWLLDRVKPERDQNRDAQRRRSWWLFGRSNRDLRRSWTGLRRIILTPETSKHRVFTFIDMPFCPDHKLYAAALDNPVCLGVLSSRVHCSWAFAAGARQGVGNDPVYNNTVCFLPFPFPVGDSHALQLIATRAAKLDRHRRERQASHPSLALTAMYNVLEKLRGGEPLSNVERRVHEQGLVSVLREIHDELDRAAFAAYGWDDLAAALVGRPGATVPLKEKSPDQAAAEDELLSRLVALNAERAAEEGRGIVRWLRPEFQNPAGTSASQAELPGVAAATGKLPALAVAAKRPWPNEPKEQARAVAGVLAASRRPMALDDVAAHFTARGRWRERIPPLLEMLEVLGRARRLPNGTYANAG